MAQLKTPSCTSHGLLRFLSFCRPPPLSFSLHLSIHLSIYLSIYLPISLSLHSTTKRERHIVARLHPPSHTHTHTHTHHTTRARAHIQSVRSTIGSKKGMGGRGSKDEDKVYARGRVYRSGINYAAILAIGNWAPERRVDSQDNPPKRAGPPASTGAPL